MIKSEMLLGYIIGVVSQGIMILEAQCSLVKRKQENKEMSEGD